MKALRLRLGRPLVFGLAAAWLAFGSAGRSGEVANPPAETAPAAPVEAPGLDLSGEFELKEAFVGDAGVRRNDRTNKFDEQDTLGSFVLSPLTRFGYLRLGGEWERYSFGLTAGTPLPNTLQAVNLIVGLDTKFSDSILVRVEAQPGFYGTSFHSLESGDLNVPFLVGGTYIFSDDFQVIAGVGVNLDQEYPVLPGVGARWKFAPHWLLNAVLPAPRLEYEFSHALTVFAGAEVKEETGRVDDEFGRSHGNDRLNRAILTYSEIRAGGGFSWKLSPSVTLTGEGGCQPYREFDFYRANARYHADGNAPYGIITLQGAF